MVGPCSSYSLFEIHICWKVDKDDKMDPPIQTLYFLSGGAITLILTVEGARALSSLVIRFTDSRHHRRATGKHHVGIELLANVDITLHDGLEGGIMNAHRFLSHQTRLEQNLGATEALRVEGDDVAIRQFVGLGTFVACCCSLHLSVKVQGNVAKFLLAQLLTGTKICKRKRDVGVSEKSRQVDRR